MRADLEKIAPERIKRLPVDEVRGYPIPWFVKWIDGKPEFRIADGAKYAQAVRQKVCWVCGEPLGRRVCFVIGPMCTVNRISSDPPSHRDCAEFSVRACPFLSKPNMERRTDNLPADAGSYFGGIGLGHNPGISVLYIPQEHRHARSPHGGYLFELGQPLEITWWVEGRLCTPAEAKEGFEAGAARLREMAAPADLKEFERCYRRAFDFLPRGAT